MARFATNNSLGGSQQNLSSTFKTQLALTAATASLTSAKLYDILVGTDGVPADNALDWDVSRQTAVGTSTAVTPNPLDSTLRAAGTVGSANFTAEGTITASSSMLFFGMNQRASYRWVCAPGSELIIPNVNLAGFAVRAKSAGYTSTVTVVTLHEE